MAIESAPKEQDLSSAPEHSVKVFEAVRLVLQDSDLPSGTLKITQTELTWTPSTEAQQAWGTKFVDISLHAISTDESSGYPPCIYAQFGDDCDEFRLIPDDESRLRELYDALCEGAEKNVDEEQEAGLAGGLLAGGSEDQVGLGGAAGMLAHLDGVLQVPPEIEGWADDAEEESEQNGDTGNGNVAG